MSRRPGSPAAGFPRRSGRGGRRAARPAFRLLLTGLLALGLACEDYPRDPEGTLDRARGGTLRVGVSDAEPWVTGSDGVPGGLEADLVRGFAETIGADVEWVRGPHQEHMEALAKFELDLVAGGVTTATPWKKDVGLTRPYLKERWLVGVPPGARPPADLEGLSIAVPEAGPAAQWVRKKGARPVRLEDVATAAGPVAAPDWKLRQMGYRPTDHELHVVERVLAAAPGENGLIVRLEEYLRRAGLRGTVGGGTP